jgi:hypothetical protein
MHMLLDQLRHPVGQFNYIRDVVRCQAVDGEKIWLNNVDRWHLHTPLRQPARQAPCVALVVKQRHGALQGRPR